jgi:hypothetical protein
MCNLYKGKISNKYYMEWNEDDVRLEFDTLIQAMKKELCA